VAGGICACMAAAVQDWASHKWVTGAGLFVWDMSQHRSPSREMRSPAVEKPSDKSSPERQPIPSRHQLLIHPLDSSSRWAAAM
jgi:hypothetical protein